MNLGVLEQAWDEADVGSLHHKRSNQERESADATGTHASARQTSQANSTAHKETPVLQGGASDCDYLPIRPVPERGLEQTVESSGETGITPKGGAESGAVGAGNGPGDPQLRAVIEAWPVLSESTKSDILEMIRAAGGEN